MRSFSEAECFASYESVFLLCKRKHISDGRTPTKFRNFVCLKYGKVKIVFCNRFNETCSKASIALFKTFFYILLSEILHSTKRMFAISL